MAVVDGLGYSVAGSSQDYATIGSALSSLSGVAERTACSIFGLTHPPKGTSDPVTAAIGSTAWTAVSRIVWVLGVDPEDESGSKRVVRVAKSNFRMPDDGLAFTIGEDEQYECGFVTGLAASTVTGSPLPHLLANALNERRRENLCDRSSNQVHWKRANCSREPERQDSAIGQLTELGQT
jgi:hypothetical protein